VSTWLLAVKLLVRLVSKSRDAPHATEFGLASTLAVTYSYLFPTTADGLLTPRRTPLLPIGSDRPEAYRPPYPLLPKAKNCSLRLSHSFRRSLRAPIQLREALRSLCDAYAIQLATSLLECRYSTSV
jgi:hypothetical protein